jgi:lipid A 3-O-deacylase
MVTVTCIRNLTIRPSTALLAVLLLCASVMHAQRSTRIDLDNDAFNFWQAPQQRADREYTQGIRATVSWPTDAGFAKRLVGGAVACDPADEAFNCRTMSVALAQEVFTPTLEARRRVAGERPYAGWLGAEFAVQREDARGFHAFSLGVGVVGKASLAEAAQKTAHRLLDFRQPEGWDKQLPSELGGFVRYRGARELLQAASASGLRVAIAPIWEVRAGSIMTDATVNLQLVAGLNPSTPWSAASRSAHGRWGLFGRAGLAQTAVARNLFLDGSTFTDSPRVAKYPFVGTTELGVGIRSPIGAIEWRVHNRQREYHGQPRPHTYSTLSFSLY